MKKRTSGKEKILILAAALTILFAIPVFASESTITIKAPTKGSVTIVAQGKTATAEAGGSDRTLTINTTSGSVSIELTAKDVSSGEDCWRWERSVNGGTSFPAGKENPYVEEIVKGVASTFVFDALDLHALTKQPAIAPTSDKDGRAEFYRCISCGKIYDLNRVRLDNYSEIPVIHSKVEAVAQVDATCEKEGTKAYYKCTVCSKIFSDSAGTKEISQPETIPASHNLQAVAQVDASCEKAGTKAYYKCSVCSRMFSDSAGTKEITKAEEIPALGHDWDAGVVTTEATASQSGVRTYTCKRDKTHTKTETIPKLEPPKTEDSEAKKTVTPDDVQMTADAITPQTPGKTETVEGTLQKSSLAWKKDLPGATFSLLQAKGTAKSNGTVKLTWKKVAGAKKYIVYGKPYGKKFKLEKLYEGKAKKYIHKQLKNKKYQKYVVLAVNGEKTLAISKAVFVAPKGTSRGNVSKVSITPKKLSLLKGKKKTLKASYTKKGTLKTYRKICFESGNITVATVTSKGKVKITGKTGDSTWIYAYAQNGVSAKIKVTVK